MIIIVYERAVKEVERLEKKIRIIQQEIDTLPDGKIFCTKNGEYYKWYKSENGKSTYIPKNEKAIAEQLAMKKYLTLRKEEFVKEHAELSRYIKNYNSYAGQADRLLHHPAYHKLISSKFKFLSNELQEWATAPYHKSRNHPKQLIFKTSSGVCVRSKSEVMIDMYLYTNKIPFHYEECLNLGDICIFPDFTIRHPHTGEYFYWEHFGMMDDPKYVLNVTSKLQTYAMYGIIPTHRLITTYETREQPLSVELVERTIEYYFL